MDRIAGMVDPSRSQVKILDYIVVSLYVLYEFATLNRESHTRQKAEVFENVIIMPFIIRPIFYKEGGNRTDSPTIASAAFERVAATVHALGGGRP